MQRKLTTLMNLVYNTEGEKYGLGQMAGFCLVILLAVLNVVYYFGMV